MSVLNPVITFARTCFVPDCAHGKSPARGFAERKHKHFFTVNQHFLCVVQTLDLCADPPQERCLTPSITSSSIRLYNVSQSVYYAARERLRCRSVYTTTCPYY